MYKIKQYGNYSHYNSKIIDIYKIDTEKETTDEEYNSFNDLYVSLCKDLEKYGYDIINNTLKKEAIIETIEANDYYFREKGDIKQI